MQAAPSSIPTSGTFFRGGLVMKTFLRPFSLFRLFKKSSCQLLVNCLGGLPRNSVARLTDRARIYLKCVEGRKTEIKSNQIICPILEHADVIWDNCSQQEKHELEKNITEWATVATGSIKLVSVQKLYKEICWERLKMRWKHKLVLFHKMYYNVKPLYLSSLVPPLV